MKRYLKFTLFLLLIMIVLTACKGKDYKEALNEGYDHLEVQQYEEASESFEKALSFKKKEEAEIGKEVANSMYDGWNFFEEGAWDEAISIAYNIIDDQRDDLAIEIVQEDADLLLTETEETEKLYNETKENLDEALQLIEDEQFEDAKKLLELIINTNHDHPLIQELIEEAQEKLNEVNKAIKDLEDEDDVDNNNNYDQSNSDNQNNNDDNIDDSNENSNENNDSTSNNGDGLSESEIETILKQELNLTDQINVHVDRLEGDDYIVQVFEVIGSGDSSHTATIGWYRVNKYTAEWEEIAL